MEIFPVFQLPKITTFISRKHPAMETRPMSGHRTTLQLQSNCHPSQTGVCDTDDSSDLDLFQNLRLMSLRQTRKLICNTFVYLVKYLDFPPVLTCLLNSLLLNISQV